MDVQKILKHLSKDQIEIIQKLYFMGATQAEVSKDLNLPLGTVKSRARAAIKVLRKFYNPLLSFVIMIRTII